MVNTKRLSDLFEFLVRIDSVSREEAQIANEIGRILRALGAETVEDRAGEAMGGNSGNLIAKIKGTADVEPLLINAHMDTVEPGRKVTPILENGCFISNGKTILGADDKSAIAIILEAIQIIKENNLTIGPLELVFTICEEIGLQGARHLDYNLISAGKGFVLDASDPYGIVTRSPYADGFDIEVFGKAAHAGAAPEKGINAITIASEAIAGIQTGRIDSETTCNIGVIEGGRAANIVPDHVVVRGEARSHNEDKLNAITESVLSSFRTVVDQYKPVAGHGLPRFDARVRRDFNCTNLPEDHPVVTLARKAAGNLGHDMRLKTTGGGSDANVFREKGIMTGVLGTGMRDMHSLRESVSLEDMTSAVELLVEIVTLHAQG